MLMVMVKYLWYLFLYTFDLSGVACRGRDPLPNEIMGWERFGRELKHRKCSACGEDFWTWKRKTRHCGRFECFVKVKSKEA